MFHCKIEIQTRADMNAECSARENLSNCGVTFDTPQPRSALWAEGGETAYSFK